MATRTYAHILGRAAQDWAKKARWRQHCALAEESLSSKSRVYKRAGGVGEEEGMAEGGGGWLHLVGCGLKAQLFKGRCGAAA